MKNSFEQPEEDKTNPEKLVSGKNFTMKPGNAFGKNRGETPIEIRPGESTEKTLAEKEAAKKRESERLEKLGPVGEFEEWLRHHTGLNGIFSETMIIKPDGLFDEYNTFDKNSKLQTYPPISVMIGNLKNPNDLYKFAKELQDKYPNYKSSFEKDPEGKWIRYTVEKIVAD